MAIQLTRRQFALGAAATLVAGTLPRGASAVTNLKYANSGNAQTLSNLFAVKIFKLVEEKTGGQVKVEVFAGNLGGEKTLIEGMGLGTIDIVNSAYTGTREFDILYSPYFFRDGVHAKRVMNGKIGDIASKVLEKRYNARLMGIGRLGPYVLALKQKISDIKEIKGMKIRTPQIEGCIEAVKHLGANPTPVPFNEVYLALQQGLVDGFVSALNPSVSMKFQEVCKYVLSNEFGLALDKELISVRAWNRLTAPQRDILFRTFNEYEVSDYYQVGLDAVAKDLETWKGFNGPDSVLTLDPKSLMDSMRPLNEKLANDVYGPGAWETIQSA